MAYTALSGKVMDFVGLALRATEFQDANGNTLPNAIGGTQLSRVSTQFDKTSDTTLANVTDLTANVLASGVYAFRAYLSTTAGASGGMKVAISGTATATSISVNATNKNGTTINANSKATALDSAVGAATAVTTDIIIEGTIVVNAAGTLTVQMAQNASNGTASSVLVNSNFSVTRIA